MENIKDSSSWCLDSPERLPVSQWLQTTLSGLEKRMKAMTDLLEEDSDSSPQKADIYYRKRTELKQMLEEVIESFADSKLKGLYSRSQSLDENSILEFYSATSNLENLNTQADQPVSTESCTMNSKPKLEHRNDIVGKENTCVVDADTSIKMNDFQDIQAAQEAFPGGSYESQNTWSELNHQFTKLMGENLQQQAELAKRNIQKKVDIKRLQLKVECLKMRECSPPGLSHILKSSCGSKQIAEIKICG
ncbi:protein NETWORKED 3C-like [Tripterygium wilfordii]|uniref:protein NETWORKED 3C-like n=1 Tax=Tripterygium wilfordii TaxID=458696 RepID=UPI0018F8542F|nr:protein NETWORKED 3C-like [Tripterygium wilfordii]